MIAFALLLALLQPVESGEEPFSDRQPVRLTPLSPDRALTAFRDVCVAGFPDTAAFDSAAAAANLDLVRREEPQRGAHEWSSANGHFVLREAPSRDAVERRDRREGRTPRQRWQVRCDFWVALRDTAEVGVLLSRITDQLAEGQEPVEEIVGASWDLSSAPGGVRRRLIFLPSIDDPRLFTLSLQQLADNPAR